MKMEDGLLICNGLTPHETHHSHERGLFLRQIILQLYLPSPAA